MNRNGQERQHRQGGTSGHKAHRSFLLSPDTIEGAIVERLEHGHAKEERFGFAATVANASPPVDESFRQTLRASIEAEAAQSVDRERRVRIISGRETKTHAGRRYPRLRLALGMSLAAGFLALVFATPLGRTLAQSASWFFDRTEHLAFPLQRSQMTTPVPSASTSESPAPLISLAEAERQAGFAVAALPFVPEGFTFLGARVADGVVSVEYEAQGGGGSLILRQSREGFVQSQWDEVPDHAIVPVKVGELDGELAQGTFVVREGDTTATWNPDVPVTRLRWVQDGIWFQITKFGDVEAIAYLDQARLTELAAGIGEHTAVADAGPQIAPEAIDALARRLGEEPGPRTVAVFPAGYAPDLAERIHHDLVPLAIDDDLTYGAVQATVGEALPHSGLVDVVLVGQARGETAKWVRASLERQLYRLYPAPAETFGALERKQYVAGLGESSLEPVNVVFENGIELVAGGVVGDPEPGEPLRLALEWRAEDRIEVEVTVFAHLVCDEGRLIAQRDAIPGNGEFPATSWEPNEVVRDQFAVPLPEELPVGGCELQVGMYDAASHRRYRPLGLDGAWHVVIQLFSIGPTGETA